jgi:hypothetical protein
MDGIFGAQDSKRSQFQECNQDHFKFHKIKSTSGECQEGTRTPLKEQREKTLRSLGKYKLRRDSVILYRDSARSAEVKNLFKFRFVEVAQSEHK